MLLQPSRHVTVNVYILTVYAYKMYTCRRTGYNRCIVQTSSAPSARTTAKAASSKRTARVLDDLTDAEEPGREPASKRHLPLMNLQDSDDESQDDRSAQAVDVERGAEVPAARPVPIVAIQPAARKPPPEKERSPADEQRPAKKQGAAKKQPPEKKVSLFVPFYEVYPDIHEAAGGDSMHAAPEMVLS